MHAVAIDYGDEEPRSYERIAYAQTERGEYVAVVASRPANDFDASGFAVDGQRRVAVLVGWALRLCFCRVRFASRFLLDAERVGYPVVCGAARIQGIGDHDCQLSDRDLMWHLLSGDSR